VGLLRSNDRMLLALTWPVGRGDGHVDSSGVGSTVGSVNDRHRAGEPGSHVAS
jgi:hypothetical protein